VSPPARNSPTNAAARRPCPGVLKMAQQPISLQSPVGDGDESNFGDFIEDKSTENPSEVTSSVC